MSRNVRTRRHLAPSNSTPAFMVSLLNVREISSYYELLLSDKLTLLLYTLAFFTARSSATSQTSFYDCRFNHVPAAGGEEGTWTTFTFTADTPGRACGYLSGSSDCSQPCVSGWTAGGQYSLNDYIAAYGDAVISSAFAQAWNLNIGDSAANDEGLQGCYGDIRFTFAGKTDVLQFTPAQ
jgi:hypothetical protein